MNCILKLTLLLLLSSYFSFTLNASYYRFSHITHEQGLNSTDLVCAFQDEKGFMWFGGYDGLFRYDGYEFLKYLPDADDSTSINVNGINKIIGSADGNIWLAGQNGIDIYNPSTGIFKNISIVEHEGKIFQFFINLSIATTRDSTLWVASQTAGILNFSLDGDLLGHYSFKDTSGIILVANHIHVSRNDDIWIGFQNGIIGRFRPGEKDPELYHFSPRDNSIKCIFEDQDGVLWIGGSKYLYSLQPQEMIFTLYGSIDKNTPVRGKEFVSIAQDNDGNMLFGADNYGVFTLLPDGSIKRDAYQRFNNQSLISNNVREVFIDEAGNLWVISYGAGINYYSKYRNNFNSYTSLNTGYPGMKDDNVKCFVHDGNKAIWIGSQNGIIRVNLDGNNPTFKPYKQINIANISALELIDNTLLVGTYLNGLLIHDLETKRNIRYDDNFLSDHSILDILIHENKAWLGYLTEGIGKLSLKDWTCNYIPPRENDPNWYNGYMIRTIFTDSYTNDIWFGAAGRGLFKYDPESNTFKTYYLEGTDTSLVNQYSVFDIVQMDDDILFLGTNMGLYYIDLKSGDHWLRAYKGNFPFNKTKIHCLILDDFNNLWLGTNQGLFSLYTKTNKWREYTVLDGLPNNNFNIGAKLKLQDGTILMGTRSGLVVFDPREIVINPVTPDIYLVDVKIHNTSVGQTISFEKNGSTIFRNISDVESLDFTYKDKVITFEFAALDFSKPEGVKYKYMLEGFDEHWNETDASTRQATYTNLHGGNYVFRVIASNGDGVWNTEGLKINVHVKPPFWKTHWFNALVIMFILFGFYFIYANRVRNLRVQKNKLRQKVNEKTIELTKKNELLVEQADQLNETNTLLEERHQRIEEQTEELTVQKDELAYQANKLSRMNSELKDLNEKKNRFFSVIAHDIKNPFNAIMGFVEMLKLDGKTLTTEKRNAYVEAIYTSSRALYNLLENLLLWARAQSDRVKFNPKIFPVRAIINESLFVQKENYKKKFIDVKVNLDEEIEVYADQDQLNIVVRNLISNAIKFTPENGNILIEGTIKGNEFILKIKDSGVGISPGDKENLFKIDKSVSTVGTDGEKGTGLGLILCKEFIENHNGKIWIESEVGKGSTFGFSIPRVYAEKNTNH